MLMTEAELRAAMGDFAYEQYIREDKLLRENPNPPAHWERSHEYDEEIADRRARGDTTS